MHYHLHFQQTFDKRSKDTYVKGQKPVEGCSTSCSTTIPSKNLVMNRTGFLCKPKCLKTITAVLAVFSELRDPVALIPTENIETTIPLRVLF